MTDSLKRSPLADLYPEETKMMDFAGWQMPRDTGSIIAEHKTVRKKTGFFDLSHMGRFIIRGPKADEKMSRLFTRDLTAADTGHALYGFICNEKGFSLDDDIFYKRSTEEIWGVVNAANSTKVYNWLVDNLSGLDITDMSAQTVLLAIQGPEAPDIFDELKLDLPEKLFRANWNNNGMLATTGYSGEAGGEAWLNIEEGKKVFKNLLKNNITFCGLGARDSLRLEKGYPLHGHELNDQIDPISAGLETFIDWEHEFKGRSALEKINRGGPKQKSQGLIFNSRRSPRPGAEVTDTTDGTVGKITSASFCPSLNKAAALALLNPSLKPDQTVKVKTGNQEQTARITPPPFI